MAIQWRKEMSVDGSIIDEDHKALIDLVNAFEAIINQKPTMRALDQSLSRLMLYSVEHFKGEEELQRAVHYPFHQAHAREHYDLVKKLEAIIAHRGAAQSGYDITVVARETLELLKEWLVSHILHTDLRMRPYVAQMKPYRQSMTTLVEHNGGSRSSSA